MRFHNKTYLRVILFFLAFYLLAFPAFTQASVVLRLMGLNPSKDETQSINLKAYLPKEAKPEDIVYKGDLETAYDSQQGSYYVYGDYELKPGEVVEREIEIKDIWFIAPREIESVRDESAGTFAQLDSTDLKERANFLKESIESKLNLIAENQKVPAANPQKHISDYRDNLKLLESVKADLVLLRSLLAQARPLSQKTIWSVFFSIVGFLALLGLALYFIWHKQLKDITGALPLQEAASSKEDFSLPKRHQAGAVKEPDSSSEIEKILGEEPEEKP